jgi:hypothetical protein
VTVATLHLRLLLCLSLFDGLDDNVSDGNGSTALCAAKACDFLNAISASHTDINCTFWRASSAYVETQ